LTDVSSWAVALAEYYSPRNFDADPMVGIVEMGHNLTRIGGVLAAGGGLASLASDTVGGLMSTIGVPLVIGGSVMAFIIPMLPFLFWIVGVTGYFLLVAEAIIAVNLWAISHLRMDGEGIAGEAGRQGYYLVLALTLTPILMIFGFLVGMTLFKVTTTLVNVGLYQVIQGMNTDGGLTWLVGIFVIVVMSILVYLVLIERSFSLIMELPSKVLRWVGADAPLSAGEGDRIRLAAAGAATTTAGAVAPVSGGIARGVNSTRHAVRHLSSKKGSDASGG
jgi:conjugal transfer/type IV secretion protein DotA/TraY